MSEPSEVAGTTPKHICPRCQREISQVGKFWICPECGPVQLDNPPGVFISYGRDDATIFANRLAEDLKRHGSVVFIDVEGIQKGATFDVRIEQGIHDAVVFAAVLTPYSVRGESICRDEAIYAHNENKQIVPLKVSDHPELRLPLLLVRRNWIDFSTSYEEGLDALLRLLHGDRSGLLPPTLETVTGVVPIDFGPEIARFSADFTGREWLAPEIDRWLTTGKRAMFILAEPGFGKSAIAAWISQKWQSIVVGIHFCTQGNSRTRDPYEFVANLVGQLNGTLPGFGDAVMKRYPEKRRNTAGDAFRELIVEVTRPPFPVPDHPYLIVVDSLDESLAQQGETILDVLIEHNGDLPPWLRLMATSRPEEAVMRRIPALSGFELNCNRPDNLADVSAYIVSRLSSGLVKGRAGVAAEIRDQLESLSAGNFLYAKMALDALADGAMTAEDISRLAPGLVQFFREMFRRRFPDSGFYQQAHAPLLRALIAARVRRRPSRCSARLPGEKPRPSSTGSMNCAVAYA